MLSGIAAFFFEFRKSISVGITLIRFIGCGIFSIAVLGIFLYSNTLLYSSLNGSMICVLPMICIPASSPKFCTYNLVR